MAPATFEKAVLPKLSRPLLERVFGLQQRGTTVRTEAFAGATTFMAAAYLVVVIPGILASGGMDLAAVTTATIVSFALGTLAMAFYANLPFVVGPGLVAPQLWRQLSSSQKEFRGRLEWP